MKKVILTTLMMSGLVMTQTTQANYIDNVTEKKLVNICQAIKSDSRLRFNRAVKNSGYNIRAVQKGLVCNGHDPITFALIHGAKANAKLIAKKTNSNFEELLTKFRNSMLQSDIYLAS